MHFIKNLSAENTGILSLLGAIAVLTASDSIIKWLSPHYALHEIMLFRAGFALIIALFIVKLEGGLSVLRTRRPVLHTLRAFLLVLANMFFFLGLAVMPLADVVAIFFAAPLFICLLSQLILREQVDAWKWFAILIGLLGVVIMLRPGQSTFSMIGLLPLMAAFTYACMQILTRKLGVNERAVTMSFYIQITFLVVCTLVGLGIGDGKFSDITHPALHFLFREWVWPTPFDTLLTALCGLLVGIGGYLLSQAYRVTAASVIAPFEYLAMPFAVFWGYYLWGDLPDTTSLMGSALIIGSGLTVLIGERRRTKLKAR